MWKFCFHIEQQFSQIEKQLISCNARLESEQKQHARLQKEHEETGNVQPNQMNSQQCTVYVDDGQWICLNVNQGCENHCLTFYSLHSY